MAAVAKTGARRALPAHVQEQITKLHRILEARATLDAGGDDVADIIAERQAAIMAADTVEAILALGSKQLENRDAVLGRPCQFTDVRFIKGDEKYAKDGSLGYFAVLTAVDLQTGLSTTFSVGGFFLLTQLVAIDEKEDGFPVDAVIFTEDTRGGREVLKMRGLSGQEYSLTTSPKF